MEVYLYFMFWNPNTFGKFKNSFLSSKYNRETNIQVLKLENSPTFECLI